MYLPTPFKDNLLLTIEIYKYINFILIKNNE